MKPFRKIKVDFDYQQLRRDVEQTFIKNKELALGTELETISHRNQCITVSKPDSDEWYDGIAGKTYGNNHWYSFFCSQGCYDNFANKYIEQVIAIAPRTECLETPIKDPIKEHHSNSWHSWTTTNLEVDESRQS